MERQSGRNIKQTIKANINSFAVLFVLIFLILFFGTLSKNFLTTRNLFTVLRQVSVTGIIAVGMTAVILTGGIDLSVGSVVGVVGVGAAMMMINGVHPVLACAIMLIVSLILGFLNGLIITYLGVPPMIATMGTMTSLRGLAYIVTGGLPVFGFSTTFKVLGQGYVFQIIPIPVLIMVVIFILGVIFLEKTRYGRYIYGVGSNEEATRLSGINIKKTKLLVYSLCGFLSGVAGIVLLSRVNSGQPNNGNGYEMNVIPAVVLGGISINGGEGRIYFVIVGVVIMGVLTNGMTMLGLSDYTQQVVQGLVLVAAVAFDKLSNAKKTLKRI